MPPVRRTDDTTAKHRAILETAARLICKRGYEGTSIQEIADACGLTKAGLYHHIESKEQLLVEIMNYGMDVFEERVLSEVEHIPDPVERLKACMAKNIQLVTRGLEQGSHHHPARARHADREGAGAHQRPQEAVRAVPRVLVRRGRGAAADSPGEPHRRRVRVPGDGALDLQVVQAGREAHRRRGSPRAWWICSSPAWSPPSAPDSVHDVPRSRPGPPCVAPRPIVRTQPLRVAGPGPCHDSLTGERNT